MVATGRRTNAGTVRPSTTIATMNSSGANDVSIGFIGTGLIARFHARNLADAARSTIAAVYDLDRDRATAFASEFGGTVMADPADVIEAVDAVYICTWTSAHPHHLMAAADAGRAVFCEKPLAVDHATATAMTDAVEAAGVVNQVGLVLRRSPSFRYLIAQVQRAESGPIMNVVFRDDQYLPTQGMYQSTWRGDPTKAGAGTLIEHSIHDLDLLSWMLGPIRSVGAHIAHVHGLSGIEDQALAWLVAESGASASLTSIWHSVLSRPSQRRVEVFCQNGVWILEGDWNGPVRWDLNTEAAAGAGVESTGSIEGPDLVSAAAQIDGLGTNGDVDFVAAVRAGQPAYPDFRVALEAHRLCELAYCSAEQTGAPQRC